VIDLVFLLEHWSQLEDKDTKISQGKIQIPPISVCSVTSHLSAWYPTYDSCWLLNLKLNLQTI